jgi:hypothetical protein
MRPMQEIWVALESAVDCSDYRIGVRHRAGV